MTDVPEIAGEAFIRLKGPLTVECGDSVVSKFRTSRTKWLLAFLAIRLGQDVLRSEIIEVLWPDIDPEVGRNRLSTELSYLRAEIEGAFGQSGVFISSTRDSLKLNVPAVSTDLDLILTKLANASQEARPLSYRMEQFRDAIEVHRGPVLDGIDEHWAISARTQLNQRIASVALDLNRQLVNRRGKGTGVPLLRMTVEQWPQSETLHVALIRELVQSRRFEEAILAFERYRHIVETEFGSEVDFETEKLLAYAQSGRLEQIRQKRIGPNYITSFVGREDEVRRLRDLVSTQSRNRIVSVIGIGGLGKTRLTTEVISQELRDGRDVLWVDLMDHSKPTELLDAVLRTVVADASKYASSEKVAAFLDGRNTLLVLDNCEDAVETCAKTVSELLDHSTDLRVLATSRIPFQIEGEFLFRLSPLPVASVSKPDESIASIQLFVDRSEAAGGAALNDSDHQIVAEICRRLDGIPLAIELVATYTHLLSPSQILDQVAFLTGPKSSDLQSVSHRSTLTGVLLWSYAKLSPPLRRIYRSLAAFHGAFSLEAAQVVSDSNSVLHEMSGLTDAALVVSDRSGSEARYRLLEPITDFLQSYWSEKEERTFETRHAEYYLNLGLRLAKGTKTNQCVAALDRLDSEYANFIAAIDFLSKNSPQAAVKLLSKLRYFWIHRNHVIDAIDRLEPLLSASDDDRTLERAEALHTAAHLLWFKSDRFEMQRHGLRAWRISNEIGDAVGLAHLVRVPYLFDVVLAREEKFDPFMKVCEIDDHVQGDDDRSAKIAAGLGRGILTAREGEVRSGLDLLTEVLTQARKNGCDWQLAEVLDEHAYMCLKVSDFKSSIESFREAREIRQRMSGSSIHVPYRAVAALPLIAVGKYLEARQIIDDAMVKTKRLGPPLELADEFLYLSYVENGEGRLALAKEALLCSLETRSKWDPSPAMAGLIQAQLAIVVHLQGNSSDARYWHARAESSLRVSPRNSQFQTWLALIESRLAIDGEDYRSALRSQIDALDYFERAGNLVGAANVLVTMAIADVAAGRISDAVDCYSVILYVRETFSFVHSDAERDWEQQKLGHMVVEASDTRFRTLSTLERELERRSARFRIEAVIA